MAGHFHRSTGGTQALAPDNRRILRASPDKDFLRARLAEPAE